MGSPFDSKVSPDRFTGDGSTDPSAPSAEREFGLIAPVYEPSRLMGRKITLSDEALGEVSRVEMLASRYDCLIGTSPLRSALAQIMSRMEGIFEAELDGRKANYRLCCYLDFLEESEHHVLQGAEAASKLESFDMVQPDPSTLDASLCAHRLEAIESAFLFRSTPDFLTPGYVLALQQIISSTFYPGIPSGLRSLAYPVSNETPPPGQRLYRPPSPMELPSYLQDLVEFINESKLGPSVKAAFVHYQIEATKMFSSCTEQISRALLVLIWRQSGLIRHLMLPLAITPLLSRPTRDKILRPYQSSQLLSEEQMLDQWIRHTAYASQNVFDMERHCYMLVSRLIGQWILRLSHSNARVTDATKKLLITVVGQPVFSISTLAKRANMSFGTVAKIVASMSQCGIIVKKTTGRRNKVYECPDAILLFNDLIPDSNHPV